jgi:hypothetical protein
MLLTSSSIRTSFVIGWMLSSTPFQASLSSGDAQLVVIPLPLLRPGHTLHMAMEIQALLVYEIFISCLFLFRIGIILDLCWPQARSIAFSGFCISEYMYLDADMDVFFRLEVGSSFHLFGRTGYMLLYLYWFSDYLR